jgi:predicted membrane channel-forming protein YqfA (hemolysin III family)
MNVWTHFIAAILYLMHVLIRPLVYGDERRHLSNTLVSVDSGSLVVTFLISSAYHVYSANRFWSAVTRLGDYFGIYLSIGSGMLVDVSVSTLNMQGVRWQATWDVYIAMAMMVAFFVLRRFMIPIDETRLPYLKDRCALGLARSTNVDLEHSSLRAGAGVVMAFCWILAMPGGYATLERDCADAFLLSHVIGTLIMIAGMVLDNVFLYPDTWFEDKGAPPGRCVCYSSKRGCGGGWVMTSHALWHIISFFSTLSTTVGLEYIVANSDLLDAR